jgi:hypothetical protein
MVELSTLSKREYILFRDLRFILIGPRMIEAGRAEAKLEIARR